MDDLRSTPSDPKPKRASLRKRIYDGLPSRGTSLRQQIRTLIFSDDSQGQIALGAAIGVFVALSPFVGTQTITALGLSLIFGASRLAALVGTLLNNPVTMPLFYLLEMKLGSYLLGYRLAMPEGIWDSMTELFSLGRKAFISIMAGFVIIGLVSSIAAYILTLGAVGYLRKRREGKQGQ